MSTQSFDPIFRQALWLTYDKKCFHHQGLIELKDMVVDHLLPEALHGSPQLQETLATYGLPAAFNIKGRENLVPSCSQCNSQKGAARLAIGIINIHIHNIKAKLPELDKQLKSLTRGMSLGQIMVRIMTSIKAGKFTNEEIAAALRAKGVIDFVANNQGITLTLNAKNNTRLKVFFAPKVIYKLKRAEIAIEDVIKALMAHTEEKAISKKFSEENFEARTIRNERIIFRIKDETRIILTAYRTAFALNKTN